jgi:5-methylcytosine-specific restriction enzyme subunit McrC
MQEPVEVETSVGERRIGRIPIKNLWLLMLYASDLARIRGACKALIEEDPDELPDLVATLLVGEVECRLRHNLTHSYRPRHMVLARVRGRIDFLTTYSKQLLSKGEVSCHFEELTIDTPRNRLVRAALDLMGRLVKNPDLALRCRSVAGDLARLGVGRMRPSRSELAAEQMGRNDEADRFMVALARLAFDLALPTEESGLSRFCAPDREEAWARRLFEKAVLGFARVELEPLGWAVRGNVQLQWQVSPERGGMLSLPQMITDIILDPPEPGGRVVIDTKFASLLSSSRFADESIRSGYLYQMYAYLRSQEGMHPQWSGAIGMFIHPAIHKAFCERFVVQSHPIIFATVDLSASASAIRSELRGLLLFEAARGLR